MNSTRRSTNRGSKQRTGKTVPPPSSLDIGPPQRNLMQKLMVWRQSCIPRKSMIEEDSQSLDLSVSSNLEKSGILTSSDESTSASLQQHQPQRDQTCAPPPPPPTTAAIRPPLARRGVTLQETTTQRPSCPVVVATARPPLLQRGVSCQTSGSRHSRHSANELPAPNQVFRTMNHQQQSTPNLETSVASDSNNHVPLEVSMRRPRFVSALEDDEDAFGDLRDFSFQEEEEEEDDDCREQEEEAVSPACVIKETVDLPSSSSSDLWVQSWVSPQTNRGDDDDVDSFIGEDEDDDSVVFISPSDEDGPDLSYLPVAPVPQAAAQGGGDSEKGDVVFTCGWAAVLRSDEFSAVRAANYESDDDNAEGASVLPTIQKSAIHYVQLLRSGHLQLVSLEKQEQQQPQKVKIESSTMRLEYVSKRVGHCLVLQGEASQTIALLPVNLPASYLAAAAAGAAAGNRKRRAAPPRFFAPFGGDGDDKEEGDGGGRCYAPHAQHAAIMHVRFGMDAALRAAVAR